MTTVVGSGALSFEVAEGWGTLPDGMTLKETPDVATDSKDNVYAFSRGDHGVVVFDRDGNFLKAWGAEVFGNAHGICIGPDDAVYCVDNGDHTVRKFSTDGELLMTLGRGARRASARDSSSFRTTSARTATTTCTWRTGSATGCRCSTPTGSWRPCGTTSGSLRGSAWVRTGTCT